MTSASWAMMLVVTVNAILFHAMPRVSRPDILFAVTVPEAFAVSAGRTLVCRYRAIVWSGAVPGGALVAVGPFAILLATALLVYTFRSEPLDGPGTIKPFQWLAFGGVYVAMMLAMAVSMARRTRQIAIDGPAAVAEQRYRRVNVLVPVLVGYGVAIQLSAATVASIPAFGDALSGSAGFVLLPLMLFNCGVTFWMFRVGQGGQRPVAPAARQEVRGDATPDHAWKLAGLLYFNPRDPAMWVENRIGVGYTLNLGNWRAWLLIIGIVLKLMIAGRLLF
jgi:uncharacterized membrane protein